MEYSFGKTSNIRLEVSKAGFWLEYTQTVRRKPAELQGNNLFRDAMKKVARIQLVKYGAVSLRSIFAEVDGDKVCLYDCNTKQNGPLIYSLCGEKLKRPLSAKWNRNTLNRIATSTKSNANRLDAALDALLMAKSKEYETERFLYLWMAMNGLYGEAAERAKIFLSSKNEKKWIRKEYGQIRFFAILNEMEYRPLTDDDSKNKMANSLGRIIGGIAPDQIEIALDAIKKDDNSADIVREIKTLFESCSCAMSPYAGLLLFLSYQIRCKYFHAEKSVPLICFEDEYPLPVLRVLNGILENYLDEVLPEWFDNEIIMSKWQPKVAQFATNCRCDNGGRSLLSCVIDGEEKA